MSNQFSTFLDSRTFTTFSLFLPYHTPLKPFSTLFPILPFHDPVTRSTRRRRKSLHLSPLATFSSPDFDLVSTTEHHDGSFIFRFGDASEIAKNDELVEDLESECTEGSSVVKVFDGDHEREVIVKTIEREDRSGGGSSIEGADIINKVDIDSNLVEVEIDAVRGLSDSQPELSEKLLEISKGEEVFVSFSDVQINDGPVLENAIDKLESLCQKDRGEESSNPVTVSVLCNGLSIENSGDLDEVLAEDCGDATMLQSVSVKLEPTIQVSHIEVMDAKDQNLEDGMQHVNIEDSGEIDIKEVLPPSHPLEAEPILDEVVSHDFLEEYAEADGIASPIMFNQDVHNSHLEERTEGKSQSSEFAEVLGGGMVPLKVSKREEISNAGFFLSSGAALLAHPSKALTGGDDAYFVACSNWIGVANGVSQWSLQGIYPGVYARELMKNCEMIVSASSSVPTINPVEVLSRSVSETHSLGSSTVLVAYFDGQTLHVANIGDTGFMIIRHGAVYKKSSPMLHEFNFALQIGRGDSPSELVEECRIDLDEGDAIVCATDGLFDNLYEQEIVRVLSKSLQAAIKPQEIAEVLATRAQEAGRSASVRSPFADAAHAAGYIGYTGGKLDDVAVIVSLVENISNFRIQ